MSDPYRKPGERDEYPAPPAPPTIPDDPVDIDEATPFFSTVPPALRWEHAKALARLLTSATVSTAECSFAHPSARSSDTTTPTSRDRLCDAPRTSRAR